MVSSRGTATTCAVITQFALLAHFPRIVCSSAAKRSCAKVAYIRFAVTDVERFSVSIQQCFGHACASKGLWRTVLQMAMVYSVISLYEPIRSGREHLQSPQ